MNSFQQSRILWITGASNDHLGYLFIGLSRILDKEDWDKIKDCYKPYIIKLNELQHKDGHNYNEEYAKRDYTPMQPIRKRPSLIIQGSMMTMSNPNIFELMLEAYKGGLIPRSCSTRAQSHLSIYCWSGTVAGQAFNDLMNSEIALILYGIPGLCLQVTAQDNLDPMASFW